MSLLEIDNISVEYETLSGRIVALSEVSFSLNNNEILGILGESGSGKSTLALTIMRALPRNAKVKAGRIMYRGRDLLSLSESELNAIRWKEISMIPQNSMNALSPVHRIGEQLYDILRLHSPGIRKKEAMEVIREKLAIANLDESVLNMYPHQLSGGMRQRVLIAASLLYEPKIILADEPTTGLDVVTQYQILRELRDLQRERGFSMMIISHDISVISNISHRTVVMYNGRVAEIGPTSSVVEKPLHPYTQMLLEVQLEIGKEARGGTYNKTSLRHRKPTSLSPEPSMGCPFAQRCPFAEERCRVKTPSLVNVGDERYVSCFLYGG